MDNKYFICAKYKNDSGELEEGFYSNDRASGGYAYFTNCFTNYCPKCGARMYLEDGETNG